MLKLKLQYFGPLMQRADSFEKTLMLGKTEGRRRRGRQRMRWLDGITDSVDMGLSELREMVEGQGSLACCRPRGHRVGQDLAAEQQLSVAKTTATSMNQNTRWSLICLKTCAHRIKY